MSVVRTRRAEAPSRLGFSEVDPSHSSASFKRYVARALEVLRRSRTPIGRATYDVISRGRVRIDELSDLTRQDFRRVRRTIASFGTRVGSDEYHRLHDRKGHAWRAIEENIRGYQWDDRIYVERGLSPEKLASTLVHEVNHILNVSEEHYRGDTAALREEYRAFYAEMLFAGAKMTPERCKSLKQQIVREYGLTEAKLEEVRDQPPGILLPRR
ncbi:MAG: hypothetical protein HYZ28_13885 [Myxococcales bacterium]|nr:hypothetical protein [Myxococcales bacterium]